ncbi:hypothetical protein BP5796_08300 [Coleophoma crateriformis]|uniref:Uncharacterized protein n=1 Tax=Coleophoma crateriformis TaxID=565419 RepID=A0A3D8R782_9HELO|nr:hypothetical protein BP5796_08300 [Coleophoma crateriformis]
MDHLPKLDHDAHVAGSSHHSNGFFDTPLPPTGTEHRSSAKKGFFRKDDDSDGHSADHSLEAMGYQAELIRSRSTLQVAFMSFVLASIPYGLATTFYYPLVGGGPANVIWGWVLTFAIFWTFAGVIAIVVCVLAIAKEGRRSAKYVFTDFEPSSGWPDGWSFCVGLLQAAYATSSTGMIISMCEEVQYPSTQVPKAMVGTIILNFFAGLLILIPLLFVLPDLAGLVALASGQPVPTIIASAVGSPGGAFGLLIPLLVLAIFCGIGCTTATSRCAWAFARDGAIPGSQWWSKVNKRLDVPLNAMMLSMIIQILLGCLYFGSAAAFNAFSGVGVICLTVSYAVPISTSLFNGRTHIKEGKFDMGMLGLVCNIVAIGWSLLAVPLFCMPSYLPVEAATMNYASVVFVAFFAIAAGWYFAWGRKHYAGPPMQ